MPPKYNPATPVIFRVLEGEVIAIFPTIAGSYDIQRTCSSYQHIGQHSACDINIGTRARLATRKEYMPLKRELEGLGYRLRVVKRIAAAHHQERIASVKHELNCQQSA